jgi:hypothetical protein
MGYSAVWAVFLVPFLLHAWNGVLDREDVSKHPVDWLMSVMASIAQLPGIFDRRPNYYWRRGGGLD